MPEHQQIQQTKNLKHSSQKRTISAIQTPVSSPAAIIQRARINPKSLTPADVLQLQRTIVNKAVGRLLSEIRNHSIAQQVPIQCQNLEEEEMCPSCVQRQETPEKDETLQRKMFKTVQRLEPKDEEKLQMKSIVQRQESPEEEGILQGFFKSGLEQAACPSCIQRKN